MAFLSEGEAFKQYKLQRIDQITEFIDKKIYLPIRQKHTLTAMNSALELTNCLKQSKKFSSVGRIWASLREK